MTLLLLLLLPLVSGLICVVIRPGLWLERVNLLGAVGVGIAAACLGGQVLQSGPVSALHGLLRADALSALVAGLTAFVALISSIYAIGYFRQDVTEGFSTPKQARRYYRLTPFFVLAMLLVVLTDNLGVMWVATEGTTLASVLLIAYYNQKSSLEAAWKYIMIGSVGLSLALFGTIVTYYSAMGVLGPDNTRGLDWSVLAGLAPKFDPGAMRLALLMTLIGFGTKAGLAPMHTWKPDAYSEAPVPAAALLGAGVINCALYGIIRFYVLAANCLGYDVCAPFLLGFGLASMLVAAPFILVQRNYRRLLAYSSIEHGGILVVALGFGGQLGAMGAMLHMLFHAVTKPLLFFCAGNIQQYFRSPFLRKVRGAIHVLPLSGALFLLVVLVVTGLPPFGIFQSEFLILSAAFAADHTWLALLFVVCVVTIFGGFFQHAVQMVLGEAPRPLTRPEVSWWKSGALILVAVCVFLLAFWLPSPIYQLVRQSAAIISGIP